MLSFARARTHTQNNTEEITSSWIARSWAGGEKGREVSGVIALGLRGGGGGGGGRFIQS